ncbi:integrase [Thermomonas sp.]|uniref:integrase n=1 Tax=Thermomonas sp. TaxID=1971895 RepID=UPI0035AD81BE
MADLIVFKPKAEIDAEVNVSAFIELCRSQLTIFGADLDFESDEWDVTKAVALRARGKGRQRARFTNLNDENQILAEPFRSFGKAYFRYMFGLRPAKAYSTRLVALRAVAASAQEMGTSSVAGIDASTFNRAAQLVGSRYAETSAYRIGQQLELLADFLDDHGMTRTRLGWVNFIPRPIDTERVGEEADKRRRSKLPSQAALDALPMIFRAAKEPADVIVSSAAAIMCGAPDRIAEVLTLPVDCEVDGFAKEGESTPYGFRWWPGKGAEPMVKWVVPSMSGVIREAIAKIRAVTEPAREVARWYEQNPGSIYLKPELEFLRGRESLSLDEVADVIGVGDGRAWCRYAKLPIDATGRVRFEVVEKAVLRLLPHDFPILDSLTGLKYSEALFVVRRNELGQQRATYHCLIEGVSGTRINNGLGSRVAHGFQSIFSKFGFREADGSEIRVNTHRFRHYLNTLAQAGGMSQLDIAKWSGRKDVRQNVVYDHVTPTQMLEKVRNAVGDSSQMFGPLAEIPVNLPVSRDEFGRLRFPTAHTTDIGFCVHDYTMSPCELHRDCLNCQDLVCVKGDAAKTERLRTRLTEARRLLDHAEQARSSGYAGSDRWLEHHRLSVARLTQLCRIMDDPAVPDGTCVQLGRQGGPLGIAGRRSVPAQKAAGVIENV